MHGSNTLFTTNSSLMTITAKNGMRFSQSKRTNFNKLSLHYIDRITDSNLALGNRNGPSDADIRRLNARYSCTSSTEAPTASGCDPSASAPTCFGETRPTLADLADCTKYYVCQGSEPIRMPCPEGLYYNSLIFVCDWPWATICCPSSKRRDELVISATIK